jgi:glycosyltransferase involved in cell wall biosynthesis
MKRRPRAQVIYDGVSVPGERSPSTDFAASGEAVVGYVGQLIPDKGIMDLVAAAPSVLAKRPDVSFAIVGWDPRPDHDMEVEIRAEVQRLGVADRFRFLGRQENVMDCVRSFTVTAVPSWEEAFGRVVVESMIAGTPVVATSAGGIPEIMLGGVGGVLVPPRDPGALAGALLRILDMPQDVRQEMAEQGRVRSGCFSIQCHARQVQALYDDLLGRRSYG